MSSGSHDLVLFVGRFHPVLVHLPIGGLVLLGVLELLAKFSRFKDAAQNSRLILGLVAVASATAALLGWMLSQSGDYDPQLLQWHQWTGFAVAATCTVTFLLSRLGWPRAYRLSLLATLSVLVVASHLGASITHGRDFLTRYAPGPLRSLFQGRAGAPLAHSTSPDPLQSRVFADVVQPILLQRCSTCHGPEKQKAELRVDTLEALLKGGKDGPVLVPGKAKDSHLIQRLLLPLNNEDHMPPEGKPQPTLAEITVLEWWIESGAPTEGQPGGAARP
jgi:uncharacterized membrane protein